MFSVEDQQGNVRIFWGGRQYYSFHRDDLFAKKLGVAILANIGKRSINRIFFPATSGAIFGPSIRTKEQHCGRVDEGTSLASTDQVLLAAASDRLEGKPAESV